tara:strand:- start:3196 stop:4149 length:954 start_codon:yes stop_codon:yes gene_type:complete
MRSSRFNLYTPLSQQPTPIYKLVNNAAVGAHAIAATVMIFIYVNRDNVVAPLTETYLKWLRVNNQTYEGVQLNNETSCEYLDPPGRFIETNVNGDFCCVPTTQAVRCDGDDCLGLDLGWLVISFHLLSFLFQGFAAFTDSLQNGILGYKYSTMIEKGKNPLRFIEYSISASIMLICIALINGVTDMFLLISITILTIGCQLMGLVVEYLPFMSPLKVILHVTGWLQFLGAYGIIAHAFFSSISAVPNVEPPEFVYWIVGLLFLLYASFGGVQLVEVVMDSQGTAIDPMNKEIAYVTLSLTAKLVLGILIFVNVLFAS